MTPTGATADFGQLGLSGLEGRGLKIVLAKQPTVVAGHGFTTGQIPRLTDFEKPPAAVRLVAGPMHSACSATHALWCHEGRDEARRTGRRQLPGRARQLLPREERGLVVITSCGHAGVINSVRQAQKVSGVGKVHAVVGGFHLAPVPDAVVAKTVAAFRDIDPDYIIPAHCTGLNTIIAVHQAMPRKLVMPSTGTRVIFGT